MESLYMFQLPLLQFDYVYLYLYGITSGMKHLTWNFFCPLIFMKIGKNTTSSYWDTNKPPDLILKLYSTV